MDEIIKKYNEYNEFGKLLGKELEVVERGHIRYKMTVNQNHQALPGKAHGGVLAAMMDGVLGVAVLSLVAPEKKFVATIEFKINYLKPVKIGDVLVGEGKVVQNGNKIFVSEGDIFVESSCVAKGLGTFKAYPSDRIE